LYSGDLAAHIGVMAHHRAHDHRAGHSHAPASFGAAFALATVLNIALVTVQVIYGLAANSLALLADAGHNLGDCLGLVLAWGAHLLARRQPTARFTYGFGSASILSALVNAVTLLVATGGIAWEAIRRLGNPSEVAGGTVIIVAAAGIAVNGVSAWLLMTGRKDDLNIRGAFLHLVGDAAVSAAVVVAGIVILLTGWTMIDPIASLVVALAILWSSWSLLRESFRLSLDAVPSGIDPDAVREFLAQLPGVLSTHDLHIWAMSTTGTALTCHLVMPGGHPGDEFLAHACHELERRFAISHATFQIEIGDADMCRLEPAHIV
jgi:cobalt-zinc-cadmium efflux system protein